MSQTGIPFSTAWRVVNDPEEIHQLRATGGALVCPAILGGCGPSVKELGRFWWNVKSTSYNDRLNGYEDTIESAKSKVEIGCEKYCQKSKEL